MHLLILFQQPALLFDEVFLELSIVTNKARISSIQEKDIN